MIARSLVVCFLLAGCACVPSVGIDTAYRDYALGLECVVWEW